MPNAAPMGRRLAELREHAAFRQQELAKAIGVSQATISLYERDAVKIPAARIAIAARVMHIPVRRFFEPAGTPLPRLSFRGAEPAPPETALWQGRTPAEAAPHGGGNLVYRDPFCRRVPWSPAKSLVVHNYIATAPPIREERPEPAAARKATDKPITGPIHKMLAETKSLVADLASLVKRKVV